MREESTKILQRTDALAHALGFIWTGSGYEIRTWKTLLVKEHKISVPVKKQKRVVKARAKIPVPENRALAESLERIRKERDWSQRRMASELGVHETYYSGLLYGRRNLPAKAISIATKLGVSPVTGVSSIPRVKRKYTRRIKSLLDEPLIDKEPVQSKIKGTRSSYHHLPEKFFGTLKDLEIGSVYNASHDVAVAHITASQLRGRVFHWTHYSDKVERGRDYFVFSESSDGSIRVKRLA